MKFLKHCLALSLLVIGFSNVHAQRNLSVSFFTPPPVSIDSSQTQEIYVKINNVDTAAYFGSFTYSYSINGTIFASSFNSGLEFDTLLNQPILPGDSIVDTLIIHPAAPAFISGPSVVVIWPTRVDGDLIAVIDSAKFELEVTTGVGIREAELGRMYYSTGRLFYQNEAEIRLRQVRIMDARGAIIVDVPVMNEQYLDVPKLPAGMYIVEAILSNNRRMAFKFVSSMH